MALIRNPVVLCFVALGIAFFTLTLVDGFVTAGAALQHLLVPYSLNLMPVVGSASAAFLLRTLLGVQILVVVFAVLVARSSKRGWRITWSIPGVVCVLVYMSLVAFAYLAPPDHIG